MTKGKKIALIVIASLLVAGGGGVAAYVIITNKKETADAGQWKDCIEAIENTSHTHHNFKISFFVSDGEGSPLKTNTYECINKKERYIEEDGAEKNEYYRDENNKIQKYENTKWVDASLSKLPIYSSPFLQSFIGQKEKFDDYSYNKKERYYQSKDLVDVSEKQYTVKVKFSTENYKYVNDISFFENGRSTYTCNIIFSEIGKISDSTWPK